MARFHVLVSGGGIGGLTAALCLARQGCHVNVFEKAPTISELGAGIQLSPNCTRVLHYLGLESALRAVAFVPEATEMRHYRTGKVLAAKPLGDSVVQRFGFPYYHIHRADLINILVAAARSDARISIHTNATVSDVSEDDKAVEVLAGGRHFRGDLLVGADGIHSFVRARLLGEESPVFTGNVAWRSLVAANTLAPNHVRPVSSAWMGPGKHFVHYFVRGGKFVNCVCVVEKSGWQSESWTERGEHAELKQDFAGWHDDVQILIDAMDREACYKWALFDRPPLARWSQGRMTLLGDACHPTLPFMAQGAAMAVEDAAVLAGAVDWTGATNDSTALSAGLNQYEVLRRPRTRQIQLGSRRNARIFHASGLTAWLRNRAMNKATRSVAHRLYSYDALNPRS